MEDLPMFVKDAANNKMLINQPSKISESDCNKDLCMTFNYVHHPYIPTSVTYLFKNIL